MIIMWSKGLKFRSQSCVCQGFQVLSPLRAHSTCSASESTILSLIALRTYTRSPRYPLTDFGAISSEAITHASYTTKRESFLTCTLIVKPLPGCPVLKKPLTISGRLVFCHSLLTRNTRMKSFCCSSMPHYTSGLQQGSEDLGP